MHRSIIYLKVPGIGDGEKKTPFIRFIAYCIPTWIFPQHIKAASPCRKLCPRGLASSAPCPSFGTQEGEVSPPVPQNPSCPIPGGPLGSCRGIASLLAAHGPGKVSVHSCLGSTPPFWVSILLFDRFWGGGAKWVPARGACPSGAAGGTPVPRPPKSFGL